MSEIPKLTEWQVLFKNFEGAVSTTGNVTLRTSKIIGIIEDHPDEEILKALAKEISDCKSHLQNHYFEQQKNRAKQYPDESKKEIDFSKDDDIDKQLKEMLGGHPEVIDKTPDDFTKYTVHPSQIELCYIDENTRLDTAVFPLSFRCFRCGHYELVNPQNPRLTCPCCDEGFCVTCQKPMKQENGKCSECNNPIKKNPLNQFSYVFACPRCANLEELTPKRERLSKVQGTSIPCQGENPCSGHMHFHMYGSFLNSFWKCETCNHKETVDKFCKCHIRKDVESGYAGKASIMKPITTSAPSITSPLIKSYLYLGSSSVSCSTLQHSHEESKTTDSENWNLQNLHVSDVKIINDKFGIEKSFTIPKITTLTIVYGYRSAISSHPIVIHDNERLAQLFQSGDKYFAYVVKTEGRGLVISLDKKKIMQILKNNSLTTADSYEELAESTITFAATTNFQTLIENRDDLPLISLLHSIEHALFSSLMEITGLEDYGSKILISDGCIILYERGDLGIGGITQITKAPNGTEFKRLLRLTEHRLKACPQRCTDSCIACIFINDFNCQPYLPNEISRWIPPNSLLDRTLTNQFFEIIGKVDE